MNAHARCGDDSDGGGAADDWRDWLAEAPPGVGAAMRDGGGSGGGGGGGDDDEDDEARLRQPWP